MEQNDPREPEMGGAEPSDAPESAGAAYESLRRIDERLQRASDAAERLLAEATARAAAGAPSGERTPPATDEQTPPPSGWQVPGNGDERRASDLELFANLLQSVRDLIPPELQRRIAEALRELLLALRALIDWYLERAEQRRREPAKVQDIPIA